MEVIEVNKRSSVRAFHRIPHRIYEGDGNWIAQPHKLVENTFDPQKNNSLKNGSVCRWIVKKDGEYVGRIAAFVVDTYAHSFEQPTGGIGFFECVDDQQAANLLFDTAVKWLKQLKMEAVDGPINIGENFFNWGVLTDGYVKQTFGMQYNKPYYEALFQGFGFKTYYEQYSYQLDIASPDLPARFWKIAEWVAKKPDYSFVKFRYADKVNFVNDFLEIYEKAWTKHDNYKKIDPADIDKMLEESKMMIEEDFIWFVYNEGKPIAFFMMVPDVNQLFEKIPSGKLNLINSLKLLWYKNHKAMTRCRVLAMGVVPKFQNSGMESAIFYHLRQVLLKKDWYVDMDLSWVGDFNPKMISLFQAVGGKQDKTHKTLRYLFDQSKEFKRAETITD